MLKLIVAAVVAVGASKAPPKDVSERSLEDMLIAISGLKEAPNDDIARTVAAVCLHAGAAADIDPLWLVAVAATESRLTLKAKGDKGRSHGPWQMCMSAARAVWPKVQRWQLYEWMPAANVAAMYWDRLRERYGERADVVYNCGPIRCKKTKTTPATRGYWRRYRRLLRGLVR